MMMVKLYERRAPSPERKQWCRPCGADAATGASRVGGAKGGAKGGVGVKKKKKAVGSIKKGLDVGALLEGPRPAEDPIGNLIHLRRMVGKLEKQVEVQEVWRERASRAEAALEEMRGVAREAEARCVALAGDVARREEQAGALARALEASEAQCEELAGAVQVQGEERKQAEELEERLASSEALNREMARDKVGREAVLEELRAKQVDSERYKGMLRRLKHDNARLCRILGTAAARLGDGVAGAVGDALRDADGATHISEGDVPAVRLPRMPQGRRGRGGGRAQGQGREEDVRLAMAELTRRYGDLVTGGPGSSVGRGEAERWVPMMSLLVMDELRESLGLTDDQFSRPCAEVLLKLNALWRARAHKSLSKVMGRYNRKVNALSRDLRGALRDEVRALSTSRSAGFHNLTRAELEALATSNADMVDRLGRRVDFLEGENAGLTAKLQRAARGLSARKPEVDAVVAISDRASASFTALVDQVKELSEEWQEGTCAIIQEASPSGGGGGAGGMGIGEGELTTSRRLVALQNEYLDKVEHSLMRWRDGMEEIRNEAQAASDNLATATRGGVQGPSDIDPTLSDVSEVSEADSDYDEFAVARAPARERDRDPVQAGSRGRRSAGLTRTAGKTVGRNRGAQIPTVPSTSSARRQRMDSLFSRPAVAPAASSSLGASSSTRSDVGAGTAIRPRKLDMDGDVSSVAERRRHVHLTGLKTWSEISGVQPPSSSLPAREREEEAPEEEVAPVEHEEEVPKGEEALVEHEEERGEDVEESDGLGVVADGSDGEESSPQEPIPVRVVGETFESYRRRLNAYRAGQRRIQGPDDTLH